MNDKTNDLEQQILELEETKKSPIKNYYRLFVFVLKNQSWLFISYLICCTIQGILSPIITLIWKKYIDLSSVRGSMSDMGGTLLATLVLFIFIMIFQSVFDVVLENIAAKFNFSSWSLLDQTISKKAASIHAEYYELPAIRAVISRAWYFTRAGFVLLFQIGLTVFSSLSKTIGLLVSLYWIEPWLFIVGVLTLIPAWIHKYFVVYEEAASKKKDSKEGIQYQYFKNVFFDKVSFREISLNNQFDFFNTKLECSKNKIITIRKNLFVKKMRFQLSESIIRNSLFVTCIILTIVEVINGKISFGSFAAVFLLMNHLMESMQELIQQITNIIRSSYSIQEFYNFLDLNLISQRFNQNGEEKTENVAANIAFSFHNVSFRYPMAQKFSLNNITVEIKKGEHVAIVGANGSGKSTFVKLLMGLLIPSSGTIYYQQENIETLNQEEYQAIFSPVFQDFNKYKDTLFYNVFIADVSRKGDTEQIRKALKLAGFYKEVGKHTFLSGEFGGIELSGGEWQKVAIARTLFSDKDILILDEPMAAIDPIRESKMYQEFASLSKGKTTFFITHRLGSVLLADKILFFEDGEMKECGTHDELLTKDEKYAAFWKTQTSYYFIDLFAQLPENY